MIQNVPIVFIHTGNHFYLNYSLSQAKITNPNNPIYLITDCLTEKFDFVKYVDINRYYSKANEFESIYKHMSTNGYKAELFCFQRWYILKEFCEEQQFSSVLYLDSDVLLYCNIAEIFKIDDVFNFTISKMLSPHCCFFSSTKTLNQFCNFIPKLYIDDNYKNRFIKKHQYHIANNLPGGVCDMTAFNEFTKEDYLKVKDISIIENNTVYDDNINDSDGFVMNKGIKYLSYFNNFYYGTLKENNTKIKFNILHFQGPAKKRIAQYYLGSNFKWITLKLKIDVLLYNNTFLYKIARKLRYKFY